jgi:peptide/nickel transport system permease protein
MIQAAGALPADSTTGARPPVSAGFWRRTWRRFSRDRASLLALGFVGLLALLALAAPFITGTLPIVCSWKGDLRFPILDYYSPWKTAPHYLRIEGRRVTPAVLAKESGSWAIYPLIYQDPHRRVEGGERENDPGNRGRQPPSLRHLFGTDEQGRDVFARVLFGTRIALLVGLISMGIASAIGITLGALAGYFGGVVDMVISRAIEVMLSIPTLVLILALMSIIERPTVYHLMAVIGLTRWETIARYTRAEFLRLKESQFVLAARALGSRWHRIVFRHLLPNALTPAIVTITFGIANAILIESALSFLGFGAPPPAPSWGSILKEWLAGRNWWLAVFPGLAVFLTVLACNMIADGVRDATDPRK